MTNKKILIPVGIIVFAILVIGLWGWRYLRVKAPERFVEEKHRISEDVSEKPLEGVLRVLRNSTSGDVSMPIPIGVIKAETPKDRIFPPEYSLLFCKKEICEEPKDFEKAKIGEELFRKYYFVENIVFLDFWPSIPGEYKILVSYLDEKGVGFDSEIISVKVNPKIKIDGAEWNTFYFDNMGFVKELEEFERKYEEAKKEKKNWVQDPKKLILEFVSTLGILEFARLLEWTDADIASKIKPLKSDASDKAIFLLESKHSLDDSVDGERYRFELIKTGEVWEIRWIGWQFLCARVFKDWRAGLCL